MPKEMAYSHEAIRSNLDGRTLKWLSVKAGIDINRLYRLASGTQEPTASEVVAICKALRIDPNQLLGTAA